MRWRACSGTCRTRRRLQGCRRRGLGGDSATTASAAVGAAPTRIGPRPPSPTGRRRRQARGAALRHGGGHRQRGVARRKRRRWVDAHSAAPFANASCMSTARRAPTPSASPRRTRRCCAAAAAALRRPAAPTRAPGAGGSARSEQPRARAAVASPPRSTRPPSRCPVERRRSHRCGAQARRIRRLNLREHDGDSAAADVDVGAKSTPNGGAARSPAPPRCSSSSATSRRHVAREPASGRGGWPLAPGTPAVRRA